MTAEELSKLLNGRQYREEITEQEEQLAKDNNLVVVFGASDDLIEFRGSFYEEFGANDGGNFYFDKGFDFVIDKPKILIKQNDIDLTFNSLHRFNLHLNLENRITQEWCPKDIKTSWKISANFPHHTFNIYDNEKLYCIGIAFNINDLK